MPVDYDPFVTVFNTLFILLLAKVPDQTLV